MGDWVGPLTRLRPPINASLRALIPVDGGSLVAPEAKL